ncbi:myo-inosose-2 dehydratase [Geminicoccaceae bacterium 1502E]|nr:myo-inosose-2 dehydratase [Geminicoccaceae bacterium 1502E]
MAVKLGIAPIGWTNDDLPELGGDIPLEQCLREAREAGYTGVEKGGKFPGKAAELRPILDSHGLELVSGWFSGGLLELALEEEKKRIAGHLALLQAMGCPVVVYAETTGTVQGRMDIPVADRRRLRHDDIRRYGEKLTALADWLKAEGCPMAFHHHMGTVIETEQEVDTLMENSDHSVGLLFDTGHLTFAGGDVPGTMRRWASRINHVHAKDIRPAVLERLRAENWSFLKGVLEGAFTVPGDLEGGIDFREVAKILKEFDYEGWIVVEAEQDPKKANPLDYAQMGHEELMAALAEAGIERA